MHLGSAVVAVLLCGSAAGQYKAINPAVKRVVDAVSEERMAATMKKLESFGTRNTVSDGAARQRSGSWRR